MNSNSSERNTRSDHHEDGKTTFVLRPEARRHLRLRMGRGEKPAPRKSSSRFAARSFGTKRAPRTVTPDVLAAWTSWRGLDSGAAASQGSSPLCTNAVTQAFRRHLRLGRKTATTTVCRGPYIFCHQPRVLHCRAKTCQHAHGIIAVGWCWDFLWC